MPSIDGRRIFLKQSQSYKQQTCSVKCGPDSASQRVAVFAVRCQGAQATSELTIADGTCSYYNALLASSSGIFEFGIPIFGAVGETFSIAVSGSGSTVCVSWGSQIG